MRVPADLPAPSTDRLRLMLDVRLALLTVAEQLRQSWSAHAAAAGLSTAQVNALLRLAPGEAVPMRSLAARLDYDASNLSVLVDRLERRGAVERRPDPADRRVKALALTEDGERLRADFWRGIVEDPGTLAPLADSDLRTLATLLDVLGGPDPAAEPRANVRVPRASE
jgi:DNA-binding MarR family transcriptional regulator